MPCDEKHPLYHLVSMLIYKFLFTKTSSPFVNLFCCNYSESVSIYS